MLIVDDALLLAILAGQEGPSHALLITAAEGGEVFTTGSWFWQLARTLARPGQGALSRALAARSEDEQRRVHNSLDQLPAEIGLLSMRRLVPVMAALPGQLNLLTAEAAAAVVLGAKIAVSTASPLLVAAAGSVDVGLDVVNLGL